MEVQPPALSTVMTFGYHLLLSNFMHRIRDVIHAEDGRNDLCLYLDETLLTTELEDLIPSAGG